MFGSCLSCIYHKTFGYDMIMLFQSVGLYLLCDLLGTECLSEFAWLFMSGVIPSASPANFELWVREIPIAEWVRSHLHGENPTSGVANLVELWVRNNPFSRVSTRSSPSGGNPIIGAVNFGLWVGTISAAEWVHSHLRVGVIPSAER